jgi:hypothetical protein
MLIACMAYSSTLTIETIFFFETSVDFIGPPGVIAQKKRLFLIIIYKE